MSIYTLESLFITLKVHAEADSKDFHEFLPNPYTYNFDRFTPLNVRLHDKRDTPYTQKDLRVVYTLWSHSLLPWKSTRKLIENISMPFDPICIPTISIHILRIVDTLYKLTRSIYSEGHSAYCLRAVSSLSAEDAISGATLKLSI